MKKIQKISKHPKFQKSPKNPKIQKKINKKIQKKSIIKAPTIQKLSKMLKKIDNLEKSLKKSFFSSNYYFFFYLPEEKKLPEEKCFPLSFPVLGGRNLTRALQSSPFQNPGGGYPERDEGRTNERTKEIIVSNIGCIMSSSDTG